MARNRFDEQLELLDTEMVLMASFVENSIEGALKAFVENDVELAKKTIDQDERVNHQEREIESLCLKLLLQQQPVARDLRVISSALKMITDLERIGDQASDIAEIVTVMPSALEANRTTHLSDMGHAAVRMVHEAVDAFVKHDLEHAHEVIAMDDTIDALFDEVRAEVVEFIRTHEDAGEEAIDMLMIAKYLERIGDHAQNVGEWVEYSLTGVHKGEQLIAQAV